MSKKLLVFALALALLLSLVGCQNSKDICLKLSCGDEVSVKVGEHLPVELSASNGTKYTVSMHGTNAVAEPLDVGEGFVLVGKAEGNCEVYVVAVKEGCETVERVIEVTVSPKDAVKTETSSVRSPEATGSVVPYSGAATLDCSNVGEGYMMARYDGAAALATVRVTKNERTYNYFIETGSGCKSLPFSEGSGRYAVAVLEQVSGNEYSPLFSGSVEVALADENLPFVSPNVYVWYDESSLAVAEGARLAATGASELETIESVYYWVISNIEYDHDKAANAAAEYIPSTDEIMRARKGVCFDFAAVMAAMLRSQGIPTRVVIGYAGEEYHAWLEVLCREAGDIDGFIFFDGNTWTRIDPTYASSGNNSAETNAFISDDANYSMMFRY